MQEKNEKISGIMADDHKCDSSIDSLINKLLVEISKESEEDFKKQTIQSTTLKLELANEDDHDIDKEITELETLIKRLQAEIVEMSETASKPSYCPSFSVIEENNASFAEASYASPEILNQAEPKNDIGFPIISKDDGILEQQVKMFAENISNIIKASDNTSPQKDNLDDVRRNFNVLWEDPTKNNLDLTEKPEETISSKLSTSSSSLETKKPIFSNIISMESIKSINNKALIEQSENFSEFCKGASPNDTRDDVQKISADNKLLGNSTDKDIPGGVNEQVADNITNNVAMLLIAEPPYNLPGNIENDPSSIVDITVPKDTIISLPKLETMEAVKTTIIKTLENVTSSDNTCTIDTPEMKQTPNMICENAIPKTDSILKSLNRTIRKIVGRGSEKSISKENHKSEDVSAEFLKAFPRSRSEPNKNFSTLDDDSSIIDSKNTTALTQDSLKNGIEGVSNTINTENFETSIIKAAKNSNEIINIVKKIIPKFVSNDLITNDTDKSKPVTENPSDTTTTTTSLSTDSGSPSIKLIQANLTTAVYNEMRINTPNGPQTKNIGYINNIPTPDLSEKNPEQDSSASIISSSVSNAFPEILDSNLQTSGQQENVMKVEMSINTPNTPQTKNIGNINDIPTPDLSKQNPEQDNSASIIRRSIGSVYPKLFDSNLHTSGQQENIMKVEAVVKGTAEESVDKNEIEQDVEAEEDIEAEEDVEAEEDDDCDDENEDDDDDENTYDVD